MKSTVVQSFLRRRLYLLKSVLVTLFFASYLVSCTLVDHQPGNTYLVSSSVVTTVSKAELAPRLAALGLPPQAPITPETFLLFDIKVYKLVYKTKNPAGQEIQASGALIVPQVPPGFTMPLISQQHGTIFTNASAPSSYAPTSEAYSAASVFAANGFILACPDYIGYGVSGDPGNPLNLLLHPYEHRASLAQASLDMIRAAKEFIQTNGIGWNNNLFLTGYSEGGFATMSLFKKIQDEVPGEFMLKGVTAGAGAYDKTAFTKELLTTTTHGDPNYNRTYLWVLLTYNQLYGINRPLSYYFVEPYLTRIATFGLGATLDVSFDQTLTQTFKDGITSGSDQVFLNALKDNNVYDWKPVTPLQLYHGTADPQVFVLNTVNAYNAMTAYGPGVPVQQFLIPGGTHQTTLASYILGSYLFIRSIP